MGWDTAVTGLSILGIVLAGLWFLRGQQKAGEAKANLEHVEAGLDASKRMADAAAQAPRDRKTLVERAREGGL